jgi:hypothetical protein
MAAPRRYWGERQGDILPNMEWYERKGDSIMISRKRWAMFLVICCCGVTAVPQARAANISEFVKLTPYVEVETTYSDNVYEISNDAPLPQDATQRDDLSLSARAGVDVDISLDRPFLSIGAGLQYAFQYRKFLENTNLDDTVHDLDVDFTFASRYEEGILRDRLKLILRNVLSLIPIDEEEPLFSGNTSLRNDFTVGLDYKLISARRVGLVVGYAYNRLDYFETEPITVITVEGYEESSILTQESQTHRGKAELTYTMNPRVTGLLTYNYALTTREEESGVLVSANFTRHNVLGGVQTRFTPRIHGTFQGGYTTTSFDDVNGASQDDQSSFVTEASVNANFAHQPLMTVGYRRYYTENDFGDTLLTDNAFARLGFRLAQGFLVHMSGDYVIEERDLYDDDTTQKMFGINSELEVIKNMSLLAGYNYRQKHFFAQNFLGLSEREETNHIVTGGLQYKVGQNFLFKGLYSYTDKRSNVPEQEFSRNQFTATGKVIF